MESPRNNEEEEEEEYSSCESGWTMYIQDAFRGNDHSSIVVDEDDLKVKEGDEESDDSMASDASSGPSNQLSKNNNNNKHAASSKKVSKQVYIQERQHTEKSLSNHREKSEIKGGARTSATSRVKSGAKVTKNK